MDVRFYPICRNIKRSAKILESWSSHIKQRGNLSLKVEYYQNETNSQVLYTMEEVS
jgi:hypothetical protein